MITTLRRTISSQKPPLIEPGDRVLVAVSGGPDSLSLLHALLTVKEELGIAAVSAAHIDHGLRGQESAAEARFVADWCAERSVPCKVGHADVAGAAALGKVAIQEAARTERYGFLQETATEFGADKIATGHTLDDRIETVLLNILRGTGIEGLKGIPYRRDRYIRPLLDTARSEVLAYCEGHGLNPRHDPSNLATDHYTRNRIRLELLPLLERDYYGGVRSALLRLSQIASRDSEYMEQQAHETLKAVTLLKPATESIVLDANKLRSLHPAMLRHVLRAAMESVRGSAANLSYDLAEQICRAIETPPASPLGITTPPPHCAIRVTKRRVTISPAQARA